MRRRGWRDRVGDAADVVDGVIGAADGLDGCVGCLYGGHCLPLVAALLGLPAFLIWWT